MIEIAIIGSDMQEVIGTVRILINKLFIGLNFEWFRRSRLHCFPIERAFLFA
jgi:hypothetical protein